MTQEQGEKMQGAGAALGRAVRAVWTFAARPSARYPLGALVAVGVVAGIGFWGSFHWALEITNTEDFCISCHAMRSNVYLEYRDTVHHANGTGVRATCPDCHVPREWLYKMQRKIYASNELLHWALGSIDSREKFEAKRLYMAKRVWATMKGTDSRECRNCHDYDSMDLTMQDEYAWARHEAAVAEGKTCIDCHQGIAHELPAGWEEAVKAGGPPLAVATTATARR